MAAVTEWILDCGNTAVKWAVFSGDSCLEHGTALDENALTEQWGTPHAIAVAASGNVPESVAALKMRFPGVRFVKLDATAFQKVFPIDYSPALGLGLDRWANVACAAQEHPSGTVVVFDAGTCLTMEVVHAGAFKGGSISPGLRMRLKSMAAGTAALPDLSSDFENASADWSERSTRQAMLSGAIGGMLLEMEGRLREIGKVWPDLTVMLTGGDASHLQLPEQYRIFADPLLTLKGIRIIYQALGDAQSPQYHP